MSTHRKPHRSARQSAGRRSQRVPRPHKRTTKATLSFDRAIENDSDSTQAPSAVVLEHAGDIYAMNGMIDDAMKYWKQALDGDGQNAVLKWKINNRQYITEDELLRRNRPAKKESVTKKIIKKGRKR